MTTASYSSVRRISPLARGLAENAGDRAFVVTDAYGRIVDASPAAAELLGNSLTSKLFIYRLAAGFRADMARLLAALRAGRPARPFDAVLRRTSGEPFTARVEGEPLRDASSTLFLIKIIGSTPPKQDHAAGLAKNADVDPGASAS